MTGSAKRKGGVRRSPPCACGCGGVPVKHGAEYIRGHRPPKPLGERFWPKVDRRGDDECWEWRGSRGVSGYGCVELPETRRLVGAHRASWILHFGSIPDGLFVLHRCDNPPCVNPHHLFLGTHEDNMADASVKGRIVASRARGERSGNARLTDAQVAEIRRRHLSGVHPARRTGNSTTELAREYGVTRQYIGQLVRGVWRQAS